MVLDKNCGRVTLLRWVIVSSYRSSSKWAEKPNGEDKYGEKESE